MLTVYLDNCCYNRPFDDRSNIKNYLEREAVLLVMQKAFDGDIRIVGSDVLEKEMQKITNLQKKEDVQSIYNAIKTDVIELNEEIVKSARDIMEHSNIKAFDSLHLASAEQTADFLLTTDIKFLKACKSLDINVSVKNPVDFVLEVDEYEYND